MSSTLEDRGEAPLQMKKARHVACLQSIKRECGRLELFKIFI